jgi:exodeoxyribonuclease VII large subunit
MLGFVANTPMPTSHRPAGVLPGGEPSGPPTGIPGSELPGPYGVGEYAGALRARLRAFAHVQIVGELVNLRPSRARVYFELRDATGAVPCAVWLNDWESILARSGGAPVEGMQVVVAGGCDFYPGSATSSPGFSFSVIDLRVAGEGDLLARIERLRRQLDAEGLLRPQKLLSRPLLPHTIGVITGERERRAMTSSRVSPGGAGWGGSSGGSRPCRTATQLR